MLIWDILTRHSAPAWITENVDDLLLRKALKRTVAHLFGIFAGQQACRQPQRWMGWPKRPPPLAVTDWRQRGQLTERSLQSFISNVTMKQGALGNHKLLEGDSFLVFLSYLGFSIHLNRHADKVKELPQTSSACIYYTSFSQPRYLSKTAIKLNNLRSHESLL